MEYIIEKVQIQNLKYVQDGSPALVDLEKTNMVVLNGQNGYGKTTFFDAIELLIVGRIEHLCQVSNKASMSKIMEELANTPQSDIVILGWLVSDKDEQIILKRRFKGKFDYECEITWNDEIIEQKDLDERLKISSALFSMGTYMSQSKSLAFLENKSKDRKNMVSELVNTKAVDDRVALMKDVSQELKEKIGKKQSELEKNVLEISEKIESLKKEIKISEEAFKEEGDYNRLFIDDYIFDRAEIEVNVPYLSFINPLLQIKSFLLDYQDYLKMIKNKRLDDTINISKEVYMKLFFSDLVQEIDDNTDAIKFVEDCYSYLSEISRENWCIKEELCKIIGVSDIDINILKKKIDDLNKFVANMGSLERSIFDIQESRKALIEDYHNGINNGFIEERKCPLCGSVFENIDNVFDNMEKTLLQTVGDSNEIKTQLINQIKKDFGEKIEGLLNKYIEKNFRIYNNFMLLKECMGVDTGVLEKKIRELEVHYFVPQSMKEVDISIFEKKYAEVMKLLTELKQNTSKPLSDEIIENYKRIHEKYYKNQEPLHSVEDIEKKAGYIAKQYVSGANKQLSKLFEEKVNAENIVKRFKDSSEKVYKNVSDLSKKYTDAYKDYQSKLVNAIRVPVLVYSGKIIQNFPLGLGIDMRIAKNQLTFEALEKKGTDVFNILSTGQLNGLAISIMLAIRKVYGNKSLLDILLIDDPLQTIDDISAISLADLLANSGINQVIMSTHEDRKAKMLEYKFVQRKLKTKEVTMKQLYLDSRKKG